MGSRTKVSLGLAFAGLCGLVAYRLGAPLPMAVLSTVMGFIAIRVTYFWLTQ